MNSLYLIGFVQTIFFVILIISRLKLKWSDVFLVSFLLTMGIRLLGIYLFRLGFFENTPQLLLFKYVYWPMFGPLLYLYISAITSDRQRFRSAYLLHFIPSFSALLAVLWFVATDNRFSYNDIIYPGSLYMIGMFMWFGISLLYFALSIAKLHRFKKSIRDFFSFTDRIDLKWLLNLTYGFGAFLTLSLSMILARIFFNIELFGIYEHISWLIITIYIFGIGFYGSQQKWIFSETNDSNDSQTPNALKAVRYRKTRLEEKENRKIKEALLGYMESKKPYVKSELNLGDLSQEINTTPHKLSQVINSNFNKNFFEFINEYRINEAKKMLGDPRYAQEKIMNIAYDSGFSSKSSFFSVFKKYTSLTPSDYRKSIA